MFDLQEFPIISKLFEDQKFRHMAQTICPDDQQHLDPFQFNIIIQTPGQSVATHIDGVYFWGASRFQFPQWLLAVMKFSGLFEDRFVHQVQVVAYLHNWAPEEKEVSQGSEAMVAMVLQRRESAVPWRIRFVVSYEFVSYEFP